MKRVIFADIATTGNRPSHVRPRDLHEALAVARAEQATAQWKELYAGPRRRRGHHAPGHPCHWIRRARYLGLPKTQLEHTITAAINMICLDA